LEASRQVGGCRDMRSGTAHSPALAHGGALPRGIKITLRSRGDEFRMTLQTGFFTTTE
jgi:hypothetical protein